MKSTWFRLAALLITAALPLRPSVLAAQRPDTVSVGARRAMVTRVELQSALDEIERGLTSTAYSQSLRAAKQAEATAIRDRLDTVNGGDLRAGDEIKIDILAEPGLSAVYTITSSRTIVLPGNLEISMRGKLRSEIQGYLTEQFKRVVNDPNVTASPSVRLSIFGGVGKPGFVNAPAGMLLSTVLMVYGGGPANNYQPKKSQIIRDGMVVVDGPEFNDAIFRGRTLDQLNVQAGDVIQVAVKPATGLIWRVVGALTGLTGLIYLGFQIFR